jgi:hypothetical protein
MPDVEIESFKRLRPAESLVDAAQRNDKLLGDIPAHAILV